MFNPCPQVSLSATVIVERGVTKTEGNYHSRLFDSLKKSCVC